VKQFTAVSMDNDKHADVYQAKGLQAHRAAYKMGTESLSRG